MKPRLDRMASALGLNYCRGIDQRGFYCDLTDSEHRMGLVTPDPVTIHMADTPRMTWEITHRFLKLAAAALHPELRSETEWRRVWLQNLYARDLGRELHVRVPRRYTEYDRAFVRASVIALPNGTPDRKQAFDWARR